MCVPTTSGTGAEVTPFAVVLDDTAEDGTQVMYHVADYALTPEMAIVDPQLAESMPRGLTASTGLETLANGLESLVSNYHTDYTTGLSMQVRAPPPAGPVGRRRPILGPPPAASAAERASADTGRSSGQRPAPPSAGRGRWMVRWG